VPAERDARVRMRHFFSPAVQFKVTVSGVLVAGGGPSSTKRSPLAVTSKLDNPRGREERRGLAHVETTGRRDRYRDDSTVEINIVKLVTVSSPPWIGPSRVRNLPF